MAHCHPLICRIGSLESEYGKNLKEGRLICRIGSLEMWNCTLAIDIGLICRIGSLEIKTALKGTM